MDSQQILKQLFDGSKSQRKRKEELDKQKKALLCAKKRDEEKIQEIIHAQLRYCAKIREGNRNSLRTINGRLFFVLFQNRNVYHQLQDVELLMKRFDHWLTKYEQAVQKKEWKAEQEENKVLFSLMKKFEQKKKEFEGLIAKERPLKHKSHLALGLLMLTITLLLFKDVNFLCSKEVFAENNRASPLNVFYPLKYTSLYFSTRLHPKNKD